MDPALREYLDRMDQNAATRSDTILDTQQTMTEQLTQQSDQLRDLANWRPDLEAWFTKL